MLKKLTNQELNEVVTEFLTEVREHITIDQAFLFGSYAKGEARETSDVDILIISKDLSEKQTKGMNAYAIESKLGKMYTQIELIAIHPNKLNNEVSKWFFDEIMGYGIKLVA